MIRDILFFIITVLIGFGVYYYLFVFKQANKKNSDQQFRKSENNNILEQQDEVKYNRRRIQREQNQNLPNENNSEEEKNQDNIQSIEQLSKKQSQKAQKKQEKAQQRESLQQQIKMKEKKDEQRRIQEEQKEIERQEQEKKEQEALLKIQEEESKKKDEEYNQWKNSFSIDDKGQLKISEEKERQFYQELNNKIIQYIKSRKVVLLEDLSIETKLSIQEIELRIQSLELNKQINGIMDERGKYIYLTENEIKSVINFINIRGRINRNELLKECNKMIKLDPSQIINIIKDKIKIKEEEKSLLLGLNSQLDQLQNNQIEVN